MSRGYRRSARNLAPQEPSREEPSCLPRLELAQKGHHCRCQGTNAHCALRRHLYCFMFENGCQKKLIFCQKEELKLRGNFSSIALCSVRNVWEGDRLCSKSRYLALLLSSFQACIRSESRPSTLRQAQCLRTAISPGSDPT